MGIVFQALDDSAYFIHLDDCKYLVPVSWLSTKSRAEQSQTEQHRHPTTPGRRTQEIALHGQAPGMIEHLIGAR